MSDRIEIRDLRVTGTHGVLPEERDRAQPFSVDIVAWVDMAAAQESDDLADTVDYGALAQTAAQFTGAFNHVCAYGWAAGEKNGVRLPHATDGESKTLAPIGRSPGPRRCRRRHR